MKLRPTPIYKESYKQPQRSSMSQEFNLLSLFMRIDRAFTSILNDYSDTQREDILKKSVCETRVHDGNIDDLHDLVKLLIKKALTGENAEIKKIMKDKNLAYNQLLDFMGSFIYLKEEGWVYNIEREFAACGYLLYGITPEEFITIDYGDAA